MKWSEFKRHFWAFVLAWMISEFSVQKSPRRAAQIKVWMKTSQTNITTNKKFHSLVWARSRYYGIPIFSPSCPCRYLPSGQPHPELPQLEVEHSGSVLGTSKPHISLVFVRWDGQALWSTFLSHPSSLSWLTTAPVVTPEPLQHIAMTLFFSFFPTSLSLPMGHFPAQILSDICVFVRWVKSFPFAPETCITNQLIMCMLSCPIAHG